MDTEIEKGDWKMKRRKSFGWGAAEVSLLALAIACIAGSLLFVLNMPEARKRKHERVEQGVAACDALHKSILRASNSETNEFLLSSTFLHAVSKSEQPLSIWNRDFVDSGGLLEEQDFIVTDDGQYFLKPDSAKGGLMRIIENESGPGLFTPQSMKRHSAQSMLACMNGSDALRDRLKRGFQ